jgi:hypothetical protein
MRPEHFARNRRPSERHRSTNSPITAMVAANDSAPAGLRNLNSRRLCRRKCSVYGACEKVIERLSFDTPERTVP